MEEKKEQFDFMKFARIYPNSNGSRRLCECSTENDAARYEKMYYEEKSVSTIEEFARLLDSEDETA